MNRKTISVFFFILGGFFFYTIGLLAFINIPEVGAFKFALMGGFSIPALIFLFTGAAICRFQNWIFSTGIVFLSVVAFNLFCIFTVICIHLTPEFFEYFPENPFASFNDYLSGMFVMLFYAGLGALLVTKNKTIKSLETAKMPNNSLKHDARAR